MSQSNPDQRSGIVVSPSQIQYTLITPDESYSHKSFYISAFALLRTFPIDLLQLKDSANFFTFSYGMGLRRGINLYSLPNFIFSYSAEENQKLFETYSGTFNKDLVKVFLIESEIDNHQHIAEMISKIKFGYFVMIGDPGEENAGYYDKSKAFATAYELITLIEKDLPEIDEIIEKYYGLKLGAFDLLSNAKADEINPYYPTMYSKTNYFVLNQILANYWLKVPDEPAKNDVPMFSKDRASIQIKQSTNIDGLWAVIKTKPAVTPIEPALSSMVIIAPFHFPNHGKLMPNQFKNKKEKMWFRVSQTEQSLDYTYGFEEDVTNYLKMEQINAIMEIGAEKLLMLDYIGYLHAQFGYSPVFRLPIVGKSLNMDLSHFQQAFSTKRNAIKKIGVIGLLMREKLIAEELADFLKNRDGQIVFISDLPMEWLRLSDYPICLTHDVCRVPEFNFNSLLNNYVHNQRLTFRIKPDILKRTLIIHCASDDETDMHQIFSMFEDLQASLGFTSVQCKSVEEISQTIKKHQPDLLIFDCHGDFDPKDLSSYLVIDDKNDVLLTGEDIVAHKISAPIVFISACSTMPNYGYVKFLSDAFFQAGAFAVTATFLPIKMGDAAALIVRLLTNIKQQETKTIFSNWLAFISHTLRSTMIFETVRKARQGSKKHEDIDNKKIAEILLELMTFSGRESAFENLKKYLQSIDPTINTGFEDLEHEWLSYTTMGRADLLYFENWLLKHQQENLGTTEKVAS